MTVFCNSRTGGASFLIGGGITISGSTITGICGRVCVCVFCSGIRLKFNAGVSSLVVTHCGKVEHRLSACDFGKEIISPKLIVNGNQLLLFFLPHEKASLPYSFTATSSSVTMVAPFTVPLYTLLRQRYVIQISYQVFCSRIKKSLEIFLL